MDIDVYTNPNENSRGNEETFMMKDEKDDNTMKVTKQIDSDTNNQHQDAVEEVPSNNNNNNKNSINLDDIVPQLQQQQQQQQDENSNEKNNITYRDLETTIRVLTAVAKLNKKKKKNSKQNTNNNINENENGKSTTCSDNNTMDTSIDTRDSCCPNKELPNGKKDNENSNKEIEDSKNKDNNENIDGLQLYKQSNLRLLRKAIANVIELHKRSMYNGIEEEQYYEQRIYNRTLKRQRIAETDLQHNFISKTILRQGRINKLNSLLLLNNNNENQPQLECNDGSENDQASSKQQKLLLAQQYLVPDGHVDTTMTTTNDLDNSSTPKLLLNSDIDGINTENINENCTTESNITSIPTVTTIPDEPIRLPKLRSCYVCKIRYRELHTFYDQLCPECAKLNWNKRHQTCNLQGKVAVVTGARVKIGYQVVLKLLRAGCTVIATTRFPNNAIDTYKKEIDFNKWYKNLHVYGLDLRDVTGLEAFTRYLKIKYLTTGGIDIIINNACQTVRRPTSYYIPAIQKEQELYNNADSIHKSILSGCYEFERIRHTILIGQQQQQNQQHTSSISSTGSSNNNDILNEILSPQLCLDSGVNKIVTKASSVSNADSLHTHISSSSSEQQTTAIVSIDNKNNNDNIDNKIDTSTNSSPATHFEQTGITHSAAMSQMILLKDDIGVSTDVLPTGMTDINGQQLDLRTHNSWLLKIDEVSTPELMECMFINAIAPFVLNSRLQPLMTTIPPSTPPSSADSNNNNSNNSNQKRPDRYIINVSAMEGKFYRYKTECHPHTNMAKAALNMLTRTCAENLAKTYNIYMNSIDTGWINDENPLYIANRIATINKFQTPIDEIDAAARIVDPIFTQNTIYGKFLKDYKETEW